MCSPRGNLLRATRTRYVSITRAFASTGKLCGCTDRSPTDYFIFIHTSNLIRRGYESVELNSRVYNTQLCVCVCVCITRFFLRENGDMFYMLAIILLHRMDALCLLGPFPILLSSPQSLTNCFIGTGYVK